MIPELIDGTIDKLEDDSVLTDYIGEGHVFLGGREAPREIPSVTVSPGTEVSKNQNGAAVSRRRNATGVVQIDVWVASSGDAFPCCSRDASVIQTRIEEVLMNPLSPVEGTKSWEKISESQQEDDGLWHNVVRFQCSYGLQDT